MRPLRVNADEGQGNYTDEDLRVRAAEAHAHLRVTDGLAADLVAPYLLRQTTWPAGTAYNRVPDDIRATLDSLRARGGQPLVTAFHRAVLLSAIATGRRALRGNPTWSSSLPLWEQAMASVIRTLPRRSDADFDYPSDLWAKDIALASGRLVHCGAQLVQPRMGISRRVLLHGGVSTLLAGSALLVRIAGHYPLYEMHVANHTLRYFTPEGWAEGYRRIARALARDREAKGLFGRAWFFDPVVEGISPHLAYLRQLPLQHGAVFMKVKTTDDGRRAAVVNNLHRRALYDAGQYKPQEYLMVWPRRAVLAAFSRDAVSVAEAPQT